jgi:hypothetical protein
MTFRTIHTLEARGNILLEIVRDRSRATDSAMRRLIWEAAEELTQMLSRRGIDYAELKSALVPRIDRAEIALVFDRTSIQSAAYGWQIHERIIPLLRPTGSHSVLHGDLGTETAAADDWVRTALQFHLQPSGNSFHLVESNQIFCVYLNNVSVHFRRTLHDNLTGYRPYIGYADTTYGSQFKAYLSQTLVPAYLKHDRIILQRHPDDEPPPPGDNMCGYPFEDAGLMCRSVGDSYYGVFLSYKIERPVVPEDEADTHFSANVISDAPIDPASCELEIDTKKFDYLKDEKTGTLRRLGVLGSPKASFEQLIQAKLSSNYIYSLAYSDECAVAKFNIVLELAPLEGGEPMRILAAFELTPETRRIRLITLFG